MSKQLTVSLSPHEKGDLSVKQIMWGVVIALIPTFLASVYFYGLNSLRVVFLSVTFCIVSEFLIQEFILKVKVTAFDGSAAVTGLLLAFNVPSGIPWWQLLVGAIAAIGIAKMAFGGLGNNPFNPALVGRAVMLASFPVQMTTWPEPMQKIWTFGADAVTTATPLTSLKDAIREGKRIVDLADLIPSYFDLFIGNVGGCVGGISVVAILLGGFYMLYKKIITYHIPVFFLLSMVAFTGVFWLIDPDKYVDPLFHILAGGVMLGAWFMATDMVTGPMSIKGQIVFAVGGGILCGAIRLFGTYPDGVAYAILIMNAFVPLIDKYFKPKRFGKEVNYEQ
ncbi:MAG: RnfABCDGE type electron transport complex subunit D [Candidatus Aminicenantes bacterium]|nr:RnfABCDGE type electron transport complex subunit D [Candidatus Aminicenantes bacterium]